jgi:hypothetical protein
MVVTTNTTHQELAAIGDVDGRELRDEVQPVDDSWSVGDNLSAGVEGDDLGSVADEMGAGTSEDGGPASGGDKMGAG